MALFFYREDPILHNYTDSTPMEAHELLLIIKSIITIEKLSFW